MLLWGKGKHMSDLKPWKKPWCSPTVRALGALVIVLLLGVLFNADGAFLKWGTHRDMLRAVSVFGILACGMTGVIISGGIDLSVGSILALASVTFSLLTLHWQWPAAWAVGACLAVGMACGVCSGALIARARMQPFIATLAMMVFARGLAKWVTGGEKISQAVKQSDGTFRYVEHLPPLFKWIDSRILWDNISVVSLIFLTCLLLCWILLDKLRVGRYLYAVGGNEQGARLSGVPIVLTRIVTYGISGLCCAVAGICQACQEYQGDPEAGAGYELSAIAMVVIGGTSLNGGKGSIWLTLIGVLTIGYLDKILSINAVGEDKRLMLTGIIVVAAVLLQKSRR
jgi:ribose transport system permease protein